MKQRSMLAIEVVGQWVIVLAVIFGLLSGTVSQAAGELIENPSDPPQRETWQMKELWRVGGDEQNDLLLGLVADVEMDGAGNVYILDSQMCQVNMLSPEGEFVRTLSRKGEGPGEVSLPSSLLIMADGEIGIVQGYPSKVIRMTTEDVPTGNIMVGDCGGGLQGTRITMNAAFRDHQLVVLGAKMTFADGRRKNTLYLASFDETGCEQLRFAGMEEKNTMGDGVWRIRELENYFPATRWALGHNGQIFLAPQRNRYQINLLNPSGELVREIRREFAPKKRTDADFERIKSGYSSNIPDLEYQFDLEEYEAAISELVCFADGSLWVTSCHSNSDLPAGIARRFDRFDDQGRLVSEVSVAMPFDPDDDGLFRLDATRFARVTGLTSAAAAESRAQGFNSGAESGKGIEAAALQVIIYEREQ